MRCFYPVFKLFQLSLLAFKDSVSIKYKGAARLELFFLLLFYYIRGKYFLFRILWKETYQRVGGTWPQNILIYPLAEKVLHLAVGNCLKNWSGSFLHRIHPCTVVPRLLHTFLTTPAMGTVLSMWYRHIVGYEPKGHKDARNALEQAYWVHREVKKGKTNGCYTALFEGKTGLFLHKKTH